MLLWIGVVGCNPVAQIYLDAASLVPAQHPALVREIEITNEDHAYVTYNLGRISLPSRRDDRRLYHVAREVGHLVFYENDYDLQFRWAAWFWWGNVPRGQLSGYTARVLAEGDWWTAAKEDVADKASAFGYSGGSHGHTATYNSSGTNAHGFLNHLLAGTTDRSIEQAIGYPSQERLLNDL